MMYLSGAVILLITGAAFVLFPGWLCGREGRRMGTLELSVGAVRLTGIIFAAAGALMLFGVLSGRVNLPLFST